MIRVLDQHTIDKIAAGEVIERPASVVKELVENSIDAGATRITVEITDGGTSMIRVTDNGSGIPAEDVTKAYLSHATSKLDNVDDLMNICSLGFRGEALSTIAAVSEVEMVTKTHEAMSGTRYEIAGGKEIEMKEVGSPDGTTIISRNLFFNTPARKKFLKTNMTEGSYINDLMSHIALANPDIAVKLISGGKTIIDTNGSGKLQDTIYQLYGKEIAKSLLEVDYEADDIKLSGYVGKPFLSKGNRSFENYFVNKRYIKSPVVNRAIEEAYKTHIMQHKFPYTALFIDVPPFMVDVNVHPAKREFRFDNEKALFSAVFHAVDDALKKKDFIPEANIDYKTREKIYTPPVTKNEAVSVSEKISQAAIKDNTIYPDIKKTPDLTNVPQEKMDISKPQENPLITEKQENPERPATSERSETSIKTETIFNEKKTVDYKNINTGAGSVAEKSRFGSGSFSVLESILPEDYRNKLSDVINTEQKPQSQVLPKESFVQEELVSDEFLSEDARPKHRIIGLAFDTYWITEFEDTLYFMDQHAAHEKINYETFLKEFKERTIHSQNIFPPVVVNLSAREKEKVTQNLEYFRKSGFDVEDYGGNDIRISAVPANLLGLSPEDVFTELTSYLVDEVSGLTEDIFVRKLASMGCKAAVKGNQKISREEAETLIDRLMKLENPYTCPHGRPTIIKITKEEVDKKFKRIQDPH